MIIVDRWLDRVDTNTGMKEFLETYDMTPDEMIRDYDLEHIKVPSHIKAIVFEDYQTFIIEEGDEVFVWSQGCYDTVFNTSGIAFMELHRDGEMKSRWSIENSPYELTKQDFEEDEDLDDIKPPEGVTFEETIFVKQL